MLNTCSEVLFPKALKTLNDCSLIYFIVLNKGTFLSNASPVNEIKAVGIYNVTPFLFSLINGYELVSQIVYPLASNVLRNPPFGNDEASDSPFIKFFPENL